MRVLIIAAGVLLAFSIMMGCGRGPAGAQGQPCTVESVDGGARIICPDGTSVEVFNGADGVDGETSVWVCRVRGHKHKCEKLEDKDND